MSRPAETYEPYDYWRPAGTRWLETSLQTVDRVFDRIYSSRYNPLHRTGTLASLFLSVALVTGMYLLFVYEIARPYESMVAIQNDVLLGRWIRALHRYTSDAAVIAVALHVVRLAAQGKTWGPRTLAWITGLLLVGAMFLSALTGFVLVWDAFGQQLAVAGAKMLRVLPIFPEPPDRSFVGDRPLPSQFFFMNLFLHVAIPLGMIAFLWLHTSRLARAAWFPERMVAWGTVIGFVLLSVIWPAPLPPAADLLVVPGRMEADWFYGFWLPFAHHSPVAALACAAVLTGLLLTVPWLWRPRARRLPPPAVVDPDTCEGCQQCYRDCPFDAIEMVTGKHPEKHALRADVQASLCVGCGLCAGSCASLAIGPAARTAQHQLASARQLVAGTAAPVLRTLVVACRSNGGVAERLRTRPGADGAHTYFNVDCAGTLHPGTVSYLAGHFAKTVILGCPPQNCVHREGAMLADARILLERPPAVPGRLAHLPVSVHHYSMGEWPSILAAIGAPAGSPAPGASVARGGFRIAATALFSALLLALVAAGSRWPQGTDADRALLRLGWRLTGQVKERCRDLTPEEMLKRPVHMRTARECVSETLTYDLKAVVDGRTMLEKRVTSQSVEEDLMIAPGDHDVTLTFSPRDAASGAKALSLERKIRFARGRVVLVTSENDSLITR